VDIPGLLVGYEYGWRHLTTNSKASRAVQSQVCDKCAGGLQEVLNASLMIA
jgi:hypothetical protein